MSWERYIERPRLHEHRLPPWSQRHRAAKGSLWRCDCDQLLIKTLDGEWVETTDDPQGGGV